MITPEQASHFAGLALKGIEQEYPNKMDHVINGTEDLLSPRALHPAFYGCFDWHSCVHGHWMLVRLLRTVPGMAEEAQVREALRRNLTASNLSVEVHYLTQPNRRSFERTYGWAWLLKLAEELHSWDDEQGRHWSSNLQPLADVFVQRYLEFLPVQTYPIRGGTHPNTAFGLALALDYARMVGNADLGGLIVQRGRDYFLSDTDAPARWEPNGNDFLSPLLMEADLMRQVLPANEYRGWFEQWLPGIADGEPANLVRPATVADRTDPQIVHLDGLNLSRAWNMRNIAAALGQEHPAYGVLAQLAQEHANAALPHVASGDYMGEHWLATFAVLMLSAPEPNL
jgi:hypothetical protein